MGKRLRQLPSCKIMAGGERASCSYFLRIINLASLFEKLAPELSRRLKESHLAGWSGNLAISNGEETVMLAINEAAVTVAPATETDHSICGGKEIVQLLVGAEAPGEIVEMAHIKLRGDAEQLITVLFPPQYPQMGNQGL